MALFEFGSVLLSAFQMQSTCLPDSGSLPFNWSRWQPDFRSFIAFEPEMQLWSDGLTKQRFLCLPAGESISVGTDGAFEFPMGTVIWKNFSHLAPNATRAEPIEFRAMQKTEKNWQFVSYLWDARTKRAEQVLAPEERELVSRDESTGANVRHTWQIPSPDQCVMCHRSRVLGLTPENVAPITQMKWFEQGFLRSYPAPDQPTLPRLDDASVSVESRARGYLAVNCAHCHNAETGGHGKFTFDLSVPFSEAGLLKAPPEFGNLGIPQAQRIAPGEPDRSVVAVRMTRTDYQRMPRLGSVRVDTKALNIVRAWISELAK